MSKYKLIAFDMDGTLLNSQKKISPNTLEALHKAAAAGKIIALSTGRCVKECEEFFELLPELRYLICTSGSVVYDRVLDQAIYTNGMSQETNDKLFEISQQEDILQQMFTTEPFVPAEKAKDMAHYQMAVYQDLFNRVMTKVDDIESFYKNEHPQLVKFNLYHTDQEAMWRTKERILAFDPTLELVRAESTGLEVTAKGVSKGLGLEKLCEAIGISIEETIAVGDAENDRVILETAGLSVAMGNALDSIKEICDVVVSDNDHDGCVEAINLM